MVAKIKQHRNNKMKQEHIDIVLAGFEATKSDDDILRELFETGLEFNELRTVFNEIVKSQGLRLSAKERKIKTSDVLDGWVPVDSEDVLAKVSLLKDELKVSDSKALSAIRVWAKESNVELPKPPRKVKELKVGFSGNYRKILDHMLENREATRKDIQAFCEASEIPVNYAGIAMNIAHFAKEWAGEIPQVTQEVAEEAA